MAYNIDSLIILFSNRQNGEMMSTTLQNQRCLKDEDGEILGDGSVNTLEPVLGYQYPCKKKIGHIIITYNLIIGKGEASGFLGLDHLLVMPKWRAISSVRDSASESKLESNRGTSALHMYMHN